MSITCSFYFLCGLLCRVKTSCNTWDDLSRNLDGPFYVPLISEVAGDENAWDIGFVSFRIINRNFAILRFRGFNTEIFQHREISVSPDQNKDYIVWQRAGLAVLILQLN